MQEGTTLTFMKQYPLIHYIKKIYKYINILWTSIILSQRMRTQKFEAYLNVLEDEVMPSWVIHWVSVTGAGSEAEAAKITRSVASSSLVLLSRVLYKGRDPYWEHIAAAAGYAGISFHQNKLRVLLGDILLMDAGEPQPFDLAAAGNYLRKAGETHSTDEILISVGF
ncbi:hypothetical protein RGQ29_030096 [Quercus rubra]|uniref:Uncharacterized protein n=1 Tax=Quercus rubra TaxID=3512 RepID=A0AAN7EH12_QUERU|nr:hypothetical protein RGQ29_030096 [Quercus rubra]